VYRALMRGRAVRANPFHPAMLAWPQASSLGKTKAISAKVAKAMISAAAAEDTRRGARDAALMQLLYDTGLRRSSVAGILRSKYVDGCITTIVKGDKEVELELPKASVTAIDRYLERAPASPYLFPGKHGHIELSSINKILKARGKAAGAAHVHPHQFRAAFVTAAYDAELPEYEIQAAVHHADARTTRRYDRKARGRKVATRLADLRKDDE
jgi:integrase